MKQPIHVPSLKVKFEDDFLHETIAIIVKESYSNIFPILMQTLVEKPHLFVDEESLMHDKLSQTISGLESISGILESMNTQQTTMSKELTDSIMIMQKMADEILIMKEQSNIQQNTLSQTLDILSSSQEGLSLLAELKEKTSINLQEVVANSQARQAVSNFDDAAKVIKQGNLSIGEVKEVVFPTQNVGIEEDDEEDDIFGGEEGMTEEERLEIISKFKPQ